MSSALPQVGDGCAQIDDHAVLREQRAIFLAQDRASPGCEHYVCSAHELRQHAAFAAAKPRFPLDLENDWDLHTGGALDFLIGIEKRLAEALGEQFTNRSLARAHEPYQKDILAGGLAAYRPGHGLHHRRDSSSGNFHTLARQKSRK